MRENDERLLTSDDDATGENDGVVASADPLDALYRRRSRICAEIVQTERTYLASLQAIDRVFVRPLRLAADSASPVLSHRAIADIFANLNDIVTVNAELLAQLESRVRKNNPSHLVPPNSSNNNNNNYDNDQKDVTVGKNDHNGDNDCHESSSDNLDSNDLEHAVGENICFGDIFLSLSPYLKIYANYVKNYQRSIKIIADQTRKNATFAQFLKNASRSVECNGLTLESYILAPVQRIPRYKLLLEDLLKHTPESHSDHVNLVKALDSIQSVATYVNEMIREHETMMEMIEIQKSLVGFPEDLVKPGRRFLKQGLLVKVCRKSNKVRMFFLFNDMLMYAAVGRSTKSLATETSSRQFLSNNASSPPQSSSSVFLSPAGSSSKNASYSFHRRLPIDTLFAHQPSEMAVANQFEIRSAEKSFLVVAPTETEMLDWIEKIQSAVQAERDRKQSLRMTMFKRSAETQYIQHDGSFVTLQNDDEEADLFQAPVWVPDNASPNCMNCRAEFTLLRRRHHCRACGRIVCHACSSKKSVIPKSSSLRRPISPFDLENENHRKAEQAVRVCDPCFGKCIEKLNNLKDALQKKSIQIMGKMLLSQTAFSDDMSSVTTAGDSSKQSLDAENEDGDKDDFSDDSDSDEECNDSIMKPVSIEQKQPSHIQTIVSSSPGSSVSYMADSYLRTMHVMKKEASHGKVTERSPLAVNSGCTFSEIHEMTCPGSMSDSQKDEPTMPVMKKKKKRSFSLDLQSKRETIEKVLLQHQLSGEKARSKSSSDVVLSFETAHRKSLHKPRPKSRLSQLFRSSIHDLGSLSTSFRTSLKLNDIEQPIRPKSPEITLDELNITMATLRRTKRSNSHASSIANSFFTPANISSSLTEVPKGSFLNRLSGSGSYFSQRRSTLTESSNDTVLLAHIMHKQGKRFKTWKERFLILTPYEVRWYAIGNNREATEMDFDRVHDVEKIFGPAISSLPLNVCTEVKETEDEKKMQGIEVVGITDLDVPSSYPFQIVTPSRALLVVANSAMERMEWVETIQGIILKQNEENGTANMNDNNTNGPIADDPMENVPVPPKVPPVFCFPSPKVPPPPPPTKAPPQPPQTK